MSDRIESSNIKKKIGMSMLIIEMSSDNQIWSVALSHNEC